MGWKKFRDWVRSFCCASLEEKLDELSMVEYTMADPETCYRPSIDAPPSDAYEGILVFCAGQMKLSNPTVQRPLAGDEEAVQGCMLSAMRACSSRALKLKHQPPK